jgi:hypothetical protein
MSLLFSNEILDSVKKELDNATSSVQIITAYCKESSFAHLNDYINDSIKDKRLLVRFRMDDVLKGSTDFSIIEFGINAGWKVYVRFDLHAKTYIVDNKRGLVGSANATNSGLSIGKQGNIEMATLVDVEPKDIEKINKLFDDAILVDNDLLTKMKEQIQKVSPAEKKESYSWDSSIITMFNPHIDTLFSYELPEDFSLLPGEYFSFLDEILEDDIESFKETFRWSNAYLWMLNVLKENDGCMFFGELSQKLHNALISDPKPYRREVKQMLANLLELIEKLDMEEISVDRPNYSQRVRLVDK